MKFRFQSFVDVSTSAQSMQIIQWSVGGADVLNRCRHLFGAYKYFKLGKITVKMVPASTLPVDPQGLSYAADDPQTVDPRDQMNPGLVRITNGEDVYTNVSKLSAAAQVQIYNSMMLDPRWSKFMLQSGFRRSAYPLYWQVGQLSQDRYPGATTNYPWLNANGDGVAGMASQIRRVTYRNVSGGAAWQQASEGGSSARGLFQVGHRGRIGFLPTDYFQEVVREGGTKVPMSGVNNIPVVNVITCVLPKAYKTIYYYRVFITEEVIFAGLRASPPVEGNSQMLGIDNFLFGSTVEPKPGTSMVGVKPNDSSMNNGEKLP
uniref:Capsid protein n=1 Tax=Porprismacovirus sp. TaxID=2805938 RepID=A0A894JTM5_9VIRU|nr:capsid protein [Porprismacovirus sp.]